MGIKFQELIDYKGDVLKYLYDEQTELDKRQLEEAHQFMKHYKEFPNEKMLKTVTSKAKAKKREMLRVMNKDQGRKHDDLITFKTIKKPPIPRQRSNRRNPSRLSF